MQRVAHLPRLRSLEISGHSYRYYDPRIIGTMACLEDLRIMMPDALLKEMLLPIIRQLDKRPGGGLRGLGIIHRVGAILRHQAATRKDAALLTGQSSSIIDEELLKLAAPALKRLLRLAIWGCTRVTRGTLLAIMEHAEDLEELSLDALPHTVCACMCSADNRDCSTFRRR